MKWDYVIMLNGMKNLYSVALQLKGELANVGLKYLKYNDLVYVSGLLKSYHKVSPSGDRNIVYQLHVKELNYVLDQNKKPKDDEDSVHSSPMLGATPEMLKEKRYTDRLHLWQVFFANPYEWWDNRQSKPWASYPDFKHKDTREKIWLHPDDPPWVRKQLELHDLEVAENGRKGEGWLLKNHNWKAQDFDYSNDEEVQHSVEAWTGSPISFVKNEEIHQAFEGPHVSLSDDLTELYRGYA